MFNVQQITSRLAELSDAQLAQYARMHKDDPYILPLASSEFKRRQQLRQSGRMQQGGPKPTVADQEVAIMNQYTLPEEQGIGVLPEQSLAQMADGGIAGYAEGGPVSFAAGGTKKGEKFNPDAYLQDPNVDKFLQYLNVYEGSPKANQLVGFKEFKGFEDHPRTPVVFNKKGAKSDAAGMFQIMSKTWDYQKKKLGLTDFSLENQKRAAVGILKDIGALQDIVEGNFDAAKAKAARQWASLPGSTIGKSTGQNPRYKPEAEAILGQPTTQQARNQPAQNQPAQRTKERSLGERLFDVLPFSKAGAAEAPQQLADFESRLAAARDAYKTRFGKDMPVTSENRTRAQQQKLYDDWKAGKPGIYTPVNPADYPGRKMFHENAADIDPRQVPESFLREFGLHRPLGKRDPVHVVAMPNWTPSGDTRTTTARTNKQTPAPVSAQTTPSTYQPPVPVAQNRNARTDTGIASIIPSAQAAEVNAPAQPPVVRSASPRPQTPSANTVVAQANAPTPKSTSALPTNVLTPDLRYKDVPGTPDALEYERQHRAANPPVPWWQQRARELLGAPEALLAATTGVAAIPVAPVVAAGRSLAGTPTTVEDALHALTFEPRSQVGKESLTALNQALEDVKAPPFIPAIGTARSVPKAGPAVAEAEAAVAEAAKTAEAARTAELPRLEGPAPVKTADLASVVRQRFVEAQERAAQAAEAAGDVEKAARLRESIKTTKEYSLSPEAKETGIQALMERRRREQAADVRRAKEAAAAAERRVAETETIASKEKVLDTGDAALAIARNQAEARRNLLAPAVIGANIDGTPSTTEGISLSETRPNPGEYFRRVAESKVPEAKRIAEQATETAPPPQPPKTSGLSNEDILTMGLNMMMAPPGQSGGALSQLASNVGRSGIATLQARRDRAKLEADQAYRDMYGKYIQAQTAQMGREPEDIRSLRLLEADPKLMQTLARKQIAGDITGAQTRLIGEFQKARMLNPTLSWDEFLKGVPEEYLPGGGMGFGLPQGVTVTRSGT